MGAVNALTFEAACSMISPDEIPLIPGLIFAALALVAWVVIELHHATPDPDPTYSRLDCLDGLDSRID